jgi:hypothetical protein
MSKVSDTPHQHIRTPRDISARWLRTRKGFASLNHEEKPTGVKTREVLYGRKSVGS